MCRIITSVDINLFPQVAVKVLRASNRGLYLNERDILSLPLLDPHHVPIFYGAEEKITLDGMPEYLLVSHFIELGEFKRCFRSVAFVKVSQVLTYCYTL